MKTFNGLTAAEIRKVERFAQKRDKVDSRVTGYGYNEVPDDFGFIKVKCEICSHDMTEREDDVLFHVFMPDRRRSFIAK